MDRAAEPLTLHNQCSTIDNMNENIFISRPTHIGEEFEVHYCAFERLLISDGLQPYRLGAGSYTLDAPLKGVIDLMDICKGAIVLGYPKYEISASIRKGGESERQIMLAFPTPWNQIEATLAYVKHLPVLIVAHEGVTGGVFDPGVTGQYVLKKNLKREHWYNDEEFQGVFVVWRSRLK